MKNWNMKNISIGVLIIYKAIAIKLTSHLKQFSHMVKVTTIIFLVTVGSLVNTQYAG